MSNNLSQEEIDKLMSGGAQNTASSPPTEGYTYLTPSEADALGEIGNISMGSAATTLSLLLGNKVDITTPRVKEYTNIEELFSFKKECVTVEIKYKVGLEGFTIFTLNVEDTAIIADLMMGGSGQVTDPEIGELQLSAVAEAMNQMIGSSSTSLASMFNSKVDITPPIVKLQHPTDKLDLYSDAFGIPIIAVSFDLRVGNLIDSKMVQLVSLDSAKAQVARLLNCMNGIAEEVATNVSTPPPPPQPVAPPPAPKPQVQTPPPSPAFTSQPAPSDVHQQPVTVQPVQFASFDESANIYGETNKNLDLLMDIRLKLTVELGKTELPIKKVLELTRGSVIELDKVAGEPVELYANGKLIAKGEVVVIEDNFGLRITSIVSPDTRLKSI